MTAPRCECTHEQGDSDCPIHVQCADCGADLSHQRVVTALRESVTEVERLRTALEETTSVAEADRKMRSNAMAAVVLAQEWIAERDKARDAAIAERDAARAEIARMRPVVEAVRAWRAWEDAVGGDRDAEMIRNAFDDYDDAASKETP